jgi:hypothetical protein
VPQRGGKPHLGRRDDEEIMTSEWFDSFVAGTLSMN